MENLVLLCRRHHRLVHEEGFGLYQAVLIRRHQFHLTRWKNHPARPRYTFPRERRGSVDYRNKEIGLNITPETLIPKWCGEKMDNQMAVLGLLQRE